MTLCYSNNNKKEQGTFKLQFIPYIDQGTEVVDVIKDIDVQNGRHLLGHHVGLACKKLKEIWELTEMIINSKY